MHWCTKIDKHDVCGWTPPPFLELCPSYSFPIAKITKCMEISLVRKLCLKSHLLCCSVLKFSFQPISIPFYISWSWIQYCSYCQVLFQMYSRRRELPESFTFNFCCKWILNNLMRIDHGDTWPHGSRYPYQETTYIYFAEFVFTGWNGSKVIFVCLDPRAAAHGYPKLAKEKVTWLGKI